VGGQGKLFNSLEVIRWNSNKRYLQYLEEHGVTVVTTIYANPQTRLEQIMSEHGWEEVVIKPVVSAGAANTYRIAKSDVDRYQPVLDGLMAEKEMMIQPFQREIVKSGEISCVVLNHRFSHGIRKTTKAGDFRVQDDHGGRSQFYAPTEEEKHFAEKAIAACPYDVVYARVDFVRDNYGRLAVMELELIEPELFFRFRPEAAQNLAAGVNALL
jgi:glutathione synthase/RimK-type ligase-like ATP-grasp enzyme